jgi:polygalacturonase
MYDITEYGAKGDGVTNDAAAIQAAVDACSNAGGGTVLFPGGKTYSSGYVILKSNVELHLEAGSVWKGSKSLSDYYPLRNNGKAEKTELGLPSYLNSEYAGKPFSAFVLAIDAENISITGEGAIDGNEPIFHGDDSGYHIEGSYYPRIPVLFLEHVKNLTLRGIRIQNSAFWTVHLVGCEDVLIDGIRILNSLKMANTDGIDPDHCRNVRISNCFISCGDDGIVLKNTGDFKKYGPCENIVITNCTIISTSAAIKFGTEGESDFRNVLVSNCCIYGSNRGISLQIRDNGNAENVLFSDIRIETRLFSHEWWGRAEAICLTASDRKPGVKAGKIKNIRFRNISCEGENGIFIMGSEDNPIEDVTFEGIDLKLKKSSRWKADGYDTRPCPGGRDGRINGKLSGVYADYAKNLKFRDVRITPEESFLPYYERDYTLLHTENVERS